MDTDGHEFLVVFEGQDDRPKAGGEVGCGVIIPALALGAFCWDGWGRGFLLDLVGGNGDD